MTRATPCVYIFVIFAVLISTATVSAVEMSSKRDCAICHVMWLNDFRTDKQTLIEWQPGNVLMKDTQGVVSSEEICYSCHDGYVNDSRYVVWKYNQHKTFVKPSNNVTVPADLPLSSRSEIYCGTCHSAHGVGAAADGSRGGMTSFFRKKNVDSSLCKRCHTNEADYLRSNGHPLKKAAFKLPETLFELGSVPGQEKNKIICQSCHKVHGAQGDKIAVVDNKSSKLCTACHTFQKDLIGTKHDLRLSLPDEKNSKQQQASESGPCGACHTPHNAVGKKLWARHPGPGDLASQMCLTCHGKETGYKTKRIGDYSHPVNVLSSAKTASPRKLPLFSAGLKRNPAGRVQCLTCHDVHRWAPNSTADISTKHFEGDASNSFLRISNSPLSPLCIECHTDKKQLMNSDHNLDVTAPDEKNLQGFTTGVSGPCGACHIPHNAAGKRLWAKRLAGEKDFVTQLCSGCHNKSGAAKAKLIGDNYHPVDIAFKTADLTSDKQKDITILPLYDGDLNRSPDERIVCLTCHEPHSWAPEKYGPISNYTFKNIEGDTTTSFLRKANFPSSDLCKACHPGKALVDGTKHDLNVTAPQATNLLGQTVKESGSCGACHLVHNSFNKLQLWARPYGPISKEESVMDALCRSCHSRGSIAENKIPLIATHPEGKLISNAMGLNTEQKNYTPLFDKEGRKTNVGNIACPSCHNAHQWKPEERGAASGPAGNSIDRFLRTASYDIVCKDCHGPDALVRYQYFHDPDKRVAK